jgi:hypothetical protein
MRRRTQCAPSMSTGATMKQETHGTPETKLRNVDMRSTSEIMKQGGMTLTSRMQQNPKQARQPIPKITKLEQLNHGKAKCGCTCAQQMRHGHTTSPPPARPTLGTRYRARWTCPAHLARCPVPALQHVCPRPGRSQPLGPRPPHWWRWPWRCGCEVAPDTHDQWWWNPQTRKKARQQTGKHKANGHTSPPAWLHAPHANQVSTRICTMRARCGRMGSR